MYHLPSNPIWGMILAGWFTGILIWVLGGRLSLRSIRKVLDYNLDRHVYWVVGWFHRDPEWANRVVHFIQEVLTYDIGGLFCRTLRPQDWPLPKLLLPRKILGGCWRAILWAALADLLWWRRSPYGPVSPLGPEGVLALLRARMEDLLEMSTHLENGFGRATYLAGEVNRVLSHLQELPHEFTLHPDTLRILQARDTICQHLQGLSGNHEPPYLEYRANLKPPPIHRTLEEEFFARSEHAVTR